MSSDPEEVAGGRADPDGYVATSEGDRRRQLRALQALELEADDYGGGGGRGSGTGSFEEDEEREGTGLLTQTRAANGKEGRNFGGFGNGGSGSGSGNGSGSGTSTKRRATTTSTAATNATTTATKALGSLASGFSNVYAYAYAARKVNLPSTSTSTERPQSQSFSIRNLLLLSGMAVLVFLFVDNADAALGLISHTLTHIPVDESAGYQAAPPHLPSFGGANNLGHPGGVKASSDGNGLLHKPVIIPVANYGPASRSLNAENVLNAIGHYWHDEHRSPYASHLYDRPRQSLEEEQSKFERMMAKVREEWGAWSFQDPASHAHQQDGKKKKRTERPIANFDTVDYKDLPNDAMPEGCWQKDPVYVKAFLKEARALVERVQEGIYAEYGSPLKKSDGTTLTEEEKAERAQRWGPKIQRPGNGEEESINKDHPAGVGTMSGVAFDGLVRKLLHAMMTNDEWYAVLGGHSAAAAHGNQFHQNKFISFHHLMEPVLDKLGVRLVSRNMGQGGVGTLQFSMAGKDMYGEADLMEWDSSMTEKGKTVDLWNKQAILAGERVPIIFSSMHFNIMEETNNTAMMGTIGTKNSMVPETTDVEQAKTLPWAARWLDGKQEKYNAVCWEPRSDVTPPCQPQDAHPGSQVSWHPGFRHHQFQGRKIALIMLKGLAAALDRWEAGIEADGFPLAESYWHVGPLYNTIRESLRTHVNTPKEGDSEAARSACEEQFAYLKMPRVCRVAMHGYGLWTPRAHNDYDFLKIIKPAPNGFKPAFQGESYYSGFNVMPLVQKVPDGEIDVHAIAIATTFPAPDLDHSYIDDDATGGANATDAADDKPPTRRWLKEATERAFRTKPKIIERISNRRITRKPVNPKIESRQSSLRRLDDGETITPGRGWYASGWKKRNEFCDGSAMSTCNRAPEEKCLAAEHNDIHKEVTGTPLSGWLVFDVPRVKEGIILIRMEWWCGKGDAISKGWTEVNDGKTLDTTPDNTTATVGRRLQEEVGNAHPYSHPDELPYGHRALGKANFDNDWPVDMKMDVAVNGKITATYGKEEAAIYRAEPSKNCALWPILDDVSMAERDWAEDDEGESVEVAIRYRSESNPHRGYCVSHVYYA